MAKIKIYTDGACSNNPGPGGWGVVLTGTKDIKVLSGFMPNTTNNRMELRAVIEAMRHILSNKDDFDDVEIYSDSAYVVNAVNNNWVLSWKKNNWRTSKGSSVKNRKMWEVYIGYEKSLRDAGIKCKLIKVKGHNGDTYNEYVDGVARNEVNKARLYIATNYKDGGNE